MGWGNFLVLATFFMMREIEAAAAVAGHLEINVVSRTVSLELPVTKGGSASCWVHEVLVMFVSMERVATGLPIPCRCRAVGIVAGQLWLSITVGPSDVPDLRWRGLCKGGDHQVS